MSPWSQPSIKTRTKPANISWQNNSYVLVFNFWSEFLHQNYVPSWNKRDTLIMNDSLIHLTIKAVQIGEAIRTLIKTGHKENTNLVSKKQQRYNRFYNEAKTIVTQSYFDFTDMVHYHLALIQHNPVSCDSVTIATNHNNLTAWGTVLYWINHKLLV